MNKYTVKLLKKENVANDTIAFSFEKPDDFTFEAGQYLNISLEKYLGVGMSGARSMSIASAPYEKYLMIVMRMGVSEFKKTLNTLPINSEVEILGPFGHLSLQYDKPAVFIAGGIGLAPFRGMILDQLEKGLKQKIYLFYSDKNPDNAAFLEELRAVKDDNFIFIPTMTGDTDNNWTGEVGRVNDKMIERYIKDITEPIYYIIGLPDMVMDIREVLYDMGVPPINIETELFTGYK